MEAMAWMSNSISQFDMDVITYQYPYNPDAGLDNLSWYKGIQRSLPWVGINLIKY